jgi:hypothetical protein
MHTWPWRLLNRVLLVMVSQKCRNLFSFVCVCVCVCVRERERETETPVAYTATSIIKYPQRNSKDFHTLLFSNRRVERVRERLFKDVASISDVIFCRMRRGKY